MGFIQDGSLKLASNTYIYFGSHDSILMAIFIALSIAPCFIVTILISSQELKAYITNAIKCFTY